MTNLKKRNYVKPAFEVFHMTIKTQLLAGSDTLPLDDEDTTDQF